MPDRLTELKEWLQGTCAQPDVVLQPASGDASFRRYFRLNGNEGVSLVVMDAPPAREDVAAFVRIAERLAAADVHTPEIFAHDLEQGFVLLEDLGDDLYLDVLNESSADQLYGDALSTLLTIQASVSGSGLPVYDREFLLREMQLFPDWLLARHLGLELAEAELAVLSTAFDVLVDSALEQPRVFVHRDYHSRNLLSSCSPVPGVIDFQDAVLGPVTYDLVSLLKDCYIAWPRARVMAWVGGYFEDCVRAGVLPTAHEGTFGRWFDLMGAQRHLKAAGIFARLAHRDDKPGYLADLPRTLNYIVELGDEYAELAPLSRFIDRRVVPALDR